jgi:hypothetical protein
VTRFILGAYYLGGMPQLPQISLAGTFKDAEIFGLASVSYISLGGLNPL